MGKNYLYVQKSNTLHIRGGCSLNPDSPNVKCFETFNEAMAVAKDNCKWCSFCYDKMFEIKNKYGVFKNCKIIGLIFLFISLPLFFFFPEIISELEPSEEATKALLIIILIVLALIPIISFLCAHKIKKNNLDTFKKYQDYLGGNYNSRLSFAFKTVAKPLLILLVAAIVFVLITLISNSCRDNSITSGSDSETWHCPDCNYSCRADTQAEYNHKKTFGHG